MGDFVLHLILSFKLKSKSKVKLSIGLQEGLLSLTAQRSACEMWNV